VALGQMEADLNGYGSMWDYAPFKLIIEEAGGKVSNLEGKEWQLHDSGFLATNGILHDEIIKIKSTMVTKDDAKNFATKEDLKQLKVVLKEDLEQVKVTLKNDLEHVKTDLIEEIKESEGFIVGSVDENKAEKTIVEDHERRLIRIKKKLVH